MLQNCAILIKNLTLYFIDSHIGAIATTKIKNRIQFKWIKFCRKWQHPLHHNDQLKIIFHL